MTEFLSNHWLAILEISLSIACLVIYVFRRNKVILKDTPFEKLLAKLPSLISVAEQHLVDGPSKKSFVLGVSYSFLADLLGVEPVEVAVKYGSRIDTAIEDILKTPQKKEVIK